MDAHTQGQVDYWAAAHQLGLDPQRPTGQEARCRCPAGCDDGHRPHDFGSSLNVATGHLACYRCGGFHLDNLTRGELPQREAPPRPEPARDPVDIIQAWKVLSGLRADHMPRVSGWPQELAEAVAAHPDVAWAPERPVGSRHADRLRVHAWSRNPSEPEGAPPRPLLVALRDPEGEVVSVMRRAVDRAASPKSKRASKSLCPAQGLALLGDLTRLPRLEGPLLLVEGETDYLAADALCGLGLLPCGGAVGTPSRSGLVGLARELVSRLPAGSRVVCIPDLGDRGKQQKTWDAGERDMERACAELVRGGHHATLLRLPTDQDGKADFCQVLEQRGLEELVKLIEAHLGERAPEAPPPGPGDGAPPPPASNDEGGGGGPDGWCLPLTDVGNRERFVLRNRDRARYSPALGGWLVWDGVRWEADTQRNRAQELGIETARAIRAEARQAGVELPEPQRIALRGALAKHAALSERAGAISAMLRLAGSHPDLAVTVEELDADPWLLGTRNGVVDLRTGALRGARRADLLTRRCDVDFDPAAPCPTWDRFLLEVMGGDGALVEYLQRAVGYSLTGSTREQVFFFLHGSGRNGKGTFVETLTDLLGIGEGGYGAAASFDTFLAGRGSGPRDDLAALRGVRLVTAGEPNEGRKLDEGFVKSITGGDTISARFLYGRPFSFRPQFKLWLSGNHRPRITGTDNGIWRRVKQIPFAVQFVDEADSARGLRGPAVDRALPDKLRRELPGVLAWAVRGALWWQEEGLCEPDAVSKATQDYRDEQDLLGAFLRECCVSGPGLKVKAQALYDAYTDWCLRGGQRPQEVRSIHEVGASIVSRGYSKTRTGRGFHYQGLGLLAPENMGGLDDD
jgi:P4 family phage/plasmid primase-like protien